jgi:trans-2,3-dihydro-3-hydroxyanthranilate isomerase
MTGGSASGAFGHDRPLIRQLALAIVRAAREHGRVPHPFVLCDVFASAPLEGNQLGVFTEGARVPEAALQPLARELNFSETTFLYPPERGGDVRVRIFTPMREWPFAGHPLLGSAAVAGERLGRAHVRLETGVGVLPVALEARGEATRARLGAPWPAVSTHAQPRELLAALRLPPRDGNVPVEDAGMPYGLVELADAEAVAALEPDMSALAPLTGHVSAACFALDGLRARLRMFAPGDGVPEDPATGSAVVALAGHLARTGRLSPGEELVVSQGREIGRPSELRATVRADADGEPVGVDLAGDVVVVAEGAFREAAVALAG